MRFSGILAMVVLLALVLAACDDEDVAIEEPPGDDEEPDEPEPDEEPEDEDPADEDEPDDDEDEPDDDEPDDEDLVTIRMGWGVPVEEHKYVMMAFPEVAPNLGEEYEVEWLQFAGTALGVQGLAAGTLDGATVGGLSSANGLAEGADIVLTGAMIEEREICTTPYVVRADDDIEEPADLEGRVRGTSAIGGSTHYIGRAEFEEAGLTEDEDYEVVEVPFAQGEEALREGEIDVMELASFFGIQALDSGDFETLFCVTDVVDPFVQLLQGFRGEFIEEHPEVVEAFQEDWQTVTEWVLDPDNRDDVITATHEATEMPEDLLEGFLLIDDLDYNRPPQGGLDVEALQDNWDFFHEVGELPELDVREHVDEEFTLEAED
ncbi:ABC transporter substrate-binding protein [Egibacter rhizosphaerae]|nr:ABC transporter substrate-binding protein [Egibacter rhizosphaerae]